MDFVIIPRAHATITTLMNSIDRVIINPLIFFLFACAMVYFLFGLVKFLIYRENEEIRKSSKAHMLWGLVGLFVMVSVFGIMRLILNTLGEDRIKIEDSGNIQVDEFKVE